MKNEPGIIEVYHAGTDLIKHPDCKFGRLNLDFGQGFYVTDVYDQAVNLARSKSLDRQSPPKINIYHLNKEKILKDGKSLIFEAYDDKWLDFIVACRSGKEIWKEYDYVEGGVADDRVINTVSLYIQGYISKDRALKNLRYMKPNNQICLINQELLNSNLTFIDCLTLPENGLL